MLYIIKKIIFFISILKENKDEILIKLQKNKEIKYLNIYQKDLESDALDFESNKTDTIFIKSIYSISKEKQPLIKFFDKNIQDVLRYKFHKKNNYNLSYNSFMKNNQEKCYYGNFIEKNYKKGKYIILENKYCLILTTESKISSKEINDLILIFPDNNYKKILTIIKNSIQDLYIYPIYKNVFCIFVNEENKQIIFLEFFPEKQKIEVISKIYYEENNNNFEILDSFEFDNKYCIFITDIGIIFYDWKKAQIIRIVKFELEKSKYEKSILVNKFYLVGICTNSIFVYNFLNDKLYEYPSNEGLFSFFKKNNYKFILNIYGNYFISWNNFSYYLISIMPNGLKFIKEGQLKINQENKINIDNDYDNNSSNNNNDDDDYSRNENEDSYNESGNEDNIKERRLFLEEDVKNIFGESLFNNTPKTNLFDNNDFKNTFSKGLFDNYNNNNNIFTNNKKEDNTKNLFNKENAKSSNLNEGLFGNLNSSKGDLFGNIENQSNNINGSLFGISNNTNRNLFGNQNNQSEGLFGNINNK